jgi:hypothetical protein
VGKKKAARAGAKVAATGSRPRPAAARPSASRASGERRPAVAGDAGGVSSGGAHGSSMTAASGGSGAAGAVGQPVDRGSPPPLPAPIASFNF